MSSISEPLTPSIRGLTYPLTVTNGNLSTSTDYSLVAQHVRSVVETRYYERVMRSDYGIDDFVLSVLNPAQINTSIRLSVEANVAEVEAVSVQGDWLTEGENGVYKIEISYTVDGVPQPPLTFSLGS